MIIKEEDQFESSPKSKFSKMRPSVTIELNHHRVKENIQKMRRVVKVITNMNRIKKRQKLKKETK